MRHFLLVVTLLVAACLAAAAPAQGRRGGTPPGFSLVGAIEVPYKSVKLKASLYRSTGRPRRVLVRFVSPRGRILDCLFTQTTRGTSSFKSRNPKACLILMLEFRAVYFGVNVYDHLSKLAPALFKALQRSGGVVFMVRGKRFRIAGYSEKWGLKIVAVDPALEKKIAGMAGTCHALSQCLPVLQRVVRRVSVPRPASVKVGAHSFAVVGIDYEARWLVRVGNAKIPCETDPADCNKTIRAYLRAHPGAIPASMSVPRYIVVDGKRYDIADYDRIEGKWILYVAGKRIACDTDPASCARRIRIMLRSGSDEDERRITIGITREF